jgi:hypothetical protein
LADHNGSGDRAQPDAHRLFEVVTHPLPITMYRMPWDQPGIGDISTERRDTWSFATRLARNGPQQMAIDPE